MLNPTLHISCKLRAHFKKITNERKGVEVKVVTAWEYLVKIIAGRSPYEDHSLITLLI